MWIIRQDLPIVILVSIFFPCLQQRNVNTSPLSSDDQHIVYPKAVPQLTTCSAPMVCIPLSSCMTFEVTGQVATTTNQKKRFPTICGWEISEPCVCCCSPKIEQPQQPQMKTHQNAFDKEVCAVQKRQDSLVRSKRDDDVHIFVVDGEDVTSNEKYPFIVGVFIRLGIEKIFLCGGSLLSQGMVLTAAHCFDNRIETDTYVLKMGSINFQPNSDISADLELNVTEVILHPDYRSPQLYNDIAILKFSGLDLYTNTIRPICLPALNVDIPVASVIGWGSTEFGGSSSAILQEASIPIVPNNECNGTFSSIGSTRASLPTGVIPSVICAGDKNSPKDACQGDSGGPLVFVDNATLQWIQVGIVSGGIGCGTPGVPGIYTRVSNYVEWIHSNL